MALLGEGEGWGVSVRARARGEGEGEGEEELLVEGGDLVGKGGELLAPLVASPRPCRATPTVRVRG